MKYTIDENGYVLFPDTPISKSGVFPYLGKSISPDLEPDKIYNVWRPEEELNNPETIESFKLSPWIPRHEMLGDQYTPAEQVGVEGVTGEEVYYTNGTLYSNLKLFGKSSKSQSRMGSKSYLVALVARGIFNLVLHQMDNLTMLSRERFAETI